MGPAEARDEGHQRSSRAVLAAVLGGDLSVALQMRWAVHLARARGMDLLLLQHMKGREQRVVEAPLDSLPPEDKKAPVVREVIRIVEDSPTLRTGPSEDGDGGEGGEGAAHSIHVRLRQIWASDLPALRQALLGELTTRRVRLITAAYKSLDTSDEDMVRERKLLLENLSCEAVYCYGLEEGTELSRILVAAADGSKGKAVVRFARDLTKPAKGTLTAVHVTPDIGAVAELVGQQRLDGLLRKSIGEQRRDVSRRVVVDSQVHRGIRSVWDEGDHDMIVVGARSRLHGGAFAGGVGARLERGASRAAVAIVRPGMSIYTRIDSQLGRIAERFVPQIDRDDRISLVERIQSGSQPDFDYFVLMFLATAIASMGLLQNSTAVVIGAMLVAPLMTPLLGMGLAVSMGNPVMTRLSLRSIALGVVVALLGGFLIGVGDLGFVEPTRQMLARGGPGVLDLWVAFASGLAASYAYCRPGLLSALPGVAIAAALVPPIATSGLAFAIADFPLALNALLLFGINVVTIIFAAMLSLWAVGIRNFKRTSGWPMIAGNAVIVLVIALGIFLSLRPQSAELARDIPAGMAQAVQNSLGADYELESLDVAFDELGSALNVRVSGTRPAPEELGTKVRTVASDFYESPVRVRLITKIEYELEPVHRQGEQR